MIPIFNNKPDKEELEDEEMTPENLNGIPEEEEKLDIIMNFLRMILGGTKGFGGDSGGTNAQGQGGGGFGKEGGGTPN